MTLRLFPNNAVSTLAVAISTTGQTTAQVQAGDGAARFPDLTPGHHFIATLTQAGTETSWEFVKCTALSVDTFTIERGKEGSTAATWAIGDKFEVRLTKEGIDFNARSLAERQVGVILPTGTTTLLSLGMSTGGLTNGAISGYTPVFNSTLAAAQKANLFTSSGLTTSSGAGWNGDNDTQCARGASAGHGGFYWRYRFIPVSIVAGNRLFIGLSTSGTNSAANGATEPSVTGSDMFGLGCDSGDTNVTIYSRDNVTMTKTALATPVAFASMSGRMYDLTVDCEPGVVTTMHLKLVEWNGNTKTVLHDGTVSANLPRTEASTTLRPQWSFGQGSDAAVARTMRLSRIFTEFASPI